MLSTILAVYPLLGKDSQFSSNVLMNTSLFKSYDQYLYGSTGLTEKGLANMLGLASRGEGADLWNDFNCWGRQERKKLVGPTEVKTWIHRIFLRASFPPARKSSSFQREEVPNTIDTVLWTCAFCIHTLGYPEHWGLRELLTSCLIKAEDQGGPAQGITYPNSHRQRGCYEQVQYLVSSLGAANSSAAVDFEWKAPTNVCKGSSIGATGSAVQVGTARM